MVASAMLTLSPAEDSDDHRDPEDQATSVLRLVANPWGSDWEPLAVGIDTLDCGYHVVPKLASEPVLAALEALREQAQSQHQPLPWVDDLLPGLLYPGAGAKSHTYRYHLETPIGHIYIRGKPVLDGTPSVFISFSSESLWCQGGPLTVARRAEAWLLARGFVTESIQPSRCDVAIDVHMPGGITRDLIEAHLVTRARQRVALTDWQHFKGYAVGSRPSPIYARIYDKTLEIQQASHKFWFWDIWGKRLTSGVIRFEFQVNRSYLRDLVPPINVLEELIARLPDVLRYLTDDWFSLRVPTNERAARRAVLPAWQAVCDEAVTRLGGAGSRTPVIRDHGLAGSREQLRIQGMSWLVNLSADSGIDDPEQAMRWGIETLLGETNLDEFHAKVRSKRIKLGRPLDGLPGEAQS